MSSSVTGLRSSGSITFPSAARTASRVGLGWEGSALQEPGVHLGQPVLEEREVAVFGGQVRVDAGNTRREPQAVPERDEPVLLTVPELHGDADRAEIEAPRVDEHAVVVEPAVTARLDPS